MGKTTKGDTGDSENRSVSTEAGNNQVADLGEFVWVTAQGQRIPVSKMGDSHLANTIRFVERRLAERPVDYGGSPDDSDGVYWALVSEERHNERIAEKLEDALSHLRREQDRRNDLLATNYKPTRSELKPQGEEEKV